MIALLLSLWGCTPDAPAPAIEWDHTLERMEAGDVFRVTAAEDGVQVVDLAYRPAGVDLEGNTYDRDAPGVDRPVSLTRYFDFDAGRLVTVSVQACNSSGCSEPSDFLTVCWPLLFQDVP